LHQTFVVAPAQFIDQMFEVRGRLEGIRAQALLQPFANGVTDRSAGSAIDCLADLVDSAGHCCFRWSVVSVSWRDTNAAGQKLFRGPYPVSGIFSKKSMNAGNIVPAEIQTRRERNSSGRSAGARSKDDWFARISSSG
jgi:hypothetical protein